MYVISKKKLREFWEKHPDAQMPLSAWHKTAERAEWNHLNEVRQTYPHADLVGKYTVFNIGGNKFRLIVDINFKNHTLYITHMITHQEYDEGNWKRPG